MRRFLLGFIAAVNFYIVQHGVRLTGMPAFGSSLNEQEIWQVTHIL